MCLIQTYDLVPVTQLMNVSLIKNTNSLKTYLMKYSYAKHNVQKVEMELDSPYIVWHFTQQRLRLIIKTFEGRITNLQGIRQ